MGVITRRRIKENLAKVEVFLTDTTNEYFAVQDIPDTFVQGRSAFKLFGSQFLKKKVLPKRKSFFIKIIYFLLQEVVGVM